MGGLWARCLSHPRPGPRALPSGPPIHSSWTSPTSTRQLPHRTCSHTTTSMTTVRSSKTKTSTPALPPGANPQLPAFRRLPGSLYRIHETHLAHLTPRWTDNVPGPGASVRSQTRLVADAQGRPGRHSGSQNLQNRRMGIHSFSEQEVGFSEAARKVAGIQGQ